MKWNEMKYSLFTQWWSGELSWRLSEIIWPWPKVTRPWSLTKKRVVSFGKSMPPKVLVQVTPLCRDKYGFLNTYSEAIRLFVQHFNVVPVNVTVLDFPKLTALSFVRHHGRVTLGHGQMISDYLTQLTRPSLSEQALIVLHSESSDQVSNILCFEKLV